MQLNDVQKFEIELHSECNLKCDFCINKFRDNHKNRIDMSDIVLNRIYEAIPKMSNLKILTMQLFNQPILESRDIDKLNEIISKVKSLTTSKDIRYKVSSNMTKTKDLNYDDILGLNVDTYSLTRYRKQDPSIIDLIENIPDIIDMFRVKNVPHPLYYIKFRSNGIEKIIELKDFTQYKNNIDNFNLDEFLLTNRGGTLTKLPVIKKETICTKRMLTVSYNGLVTGCCEIYPNLPVHKDYIFGDLNNERIEDALKSNAAVSFYNSVCNVETLPLPCKNCTDGNTVFQMTKIYDECIKKKRSLF